MPCPVAQHMIYIINNNILYTIHMHIIMLTYIVHAHAYVHTAQQCTQGCSMHVCTHVCTRERICCMHTYYYAYMHMPCPVPMCPCTYMPLYMYIIAQRLYYLSQIEQMSYAWCMGSTHRPCPMPMLYRCIHTA